MVKEGEAAAYVTEGQTRMDGELPVNATGGLIGFGHPTGGTGVRQAADIWQQLTGNAGDCQLKIKSQKPHGLMINMGAFRCGDHIHPLHEVFMLRGRHDQCEIHNFRQGLTQAMTGDTQTTMYCGYVAPAQHKHLVLFHIRTARLECYK